MTNHDTKSQEHDGKHFKMLSTQAGVRHGEIHPVTFREGETYAIDESLKKQFESLGAIEPSTAEPVEPDAHQPGSAATWKEPINEGVLEEDPAALRHAELPVEQIHAQNDYAQAHGDMTPETAAALGRDAHTPPAEPVLAAEGEKPAKAAHAKPKAKH